MSQRPRPEASDDGPAPEPGPASTDSPRPTGPRLFPSSSSLPRIVSWRSAVLVALGGAVLVTVSLGPMATELGNVSVLVWIVAAAVGAAQCLLLAELASRFSSRAGGTAQFAHRALRRGSPSLGALSSWSYWFAWTPGIAVNLILAATYLREVLFPHVPVIPLAIAIGVVLYIVNSYGLRLSMRLNALLAVVTVIPLLAIAAGPLIKPSAFHVGHLLPLRLPDTAPGGGWALTALIAKWFFVAAWVAYGAEMASTVCAEMRDCAGRMPRAMALAAGACLAAFGLLPIVLLGLIGTEGLGDDPVTGFVPAAEVLFGSAGKTVIGLVLAAALVLGAQAFIFTSSRTVYQISRDGHLPSLFARVNKRGVPVGSMVWDATVIALMLAVFGTRVVEVVAAANVGYLIVFILMPMAYLVLRRTPGGDPGGLRLPRPAAGLALALAVLNAAALVVGGAQWGVRVMTIGLGVSLLIVPVSYLTRRTAARRDRDGS
ncbi:APC family permease, partial [Streptomyces sp. NPDC049577]|uniref:APC family permease n=1 Tax=Streptomyces sp. NPDC049577 TaxID=3155153 RepID=UPI003416981D